VTSVLLDSSALLAHYFGESRGEVVRDHLASGEALIAAPTCFEFRTRLTALGVPDAVSGDALKRYRLAFSEVVSVDDAVVDRAWEIRRATPTRLPTVDAFIAACASVRGATLIHADEHMAAIPTSLVSQVRLPPR
jgi:predicted nucleic acid-binding protein